MLLGVVDRDIADESELRGQVRAWLEKNHPNLLK